MSPLLSPASEESITAESIGTQIRALVLERPRPSSLLGYIKRIVETLTDVIVSGPCAQDSITGYQGMFRRTEPRDGRDRHEPGTMRQPREAEIEPCQRAGPFDLQNKIRDSSSAVAALPRGVSSRTWTAGE